MRHTILAAMLLGLSGTGAAYDFNEWPTNYTTESGLELGAKAVFQYDDSEFSDDRLSNGTARFEDLHGWRRREVGFYLRRQGVFELVLGYDLATETWLDNYFKFTAGKAGDFRLGQFKTPVGLEDGATSSSATTFLERGLPEAAIHQGRRIGLDWTYASVSRWLFNLAVFSGGDLNGLSDGQTLAGRVVLTPVRNEHEVLHLGLSASRERLDDEIARIRARPEVGITDVRLIDTGDLTNAEAIDRYGLEAVWRRGPWSVQSEWLGTKVRRDDGLADFQGAGAYLQGSWIVTGESRPYKNGAFGNPLPARPWGAFELALRYSTLDLDDTSVNGGRQRDWTLGANWYLGRYFKLQANYIRVHSDRDTTSLDPNIVAVRAQVAF